MGASRIFPEAQGKCERKRIREWRFCQFMTGWKNGELLIAAETASFQRSPRSRSIL
jgi:hypothetical protein